jgi:hypothetical protein
MSSLLPQDQNAMIAMPYPFAQPRRDAADASASPTNRWAELTGSGQRLRQALPTSLDRDPMLAIAWERHDSKPNFAEFLQPEHWNVVVFSEFFLEFFLEFSWSSRGRTYGND